MLVLMYIYFFTLIFKPFDSDEAFLRRSSFLSLLLGFVILISCVASNSQMKQMLSILPKHSNKSPGGKAEFTPFLLGFLIMPVQDLFDPSRNWCIPGVKQCVSDKFCSYSYGEDCHPLLLAYWVFFFLLRNDLYFITSVSKLDTLF